MYGFGTCPFGAFDYWSVLRLPGVAMVVLSILPSDSVAIRFTALAWSTYQFVDTIISSSAGSSPYTDGVWRAGWISPATPYK